MSGQFGLLLPLWLAILWATTAYLAVLGISVLFIPARAYDFLAGFAQTPRANIIEAVLRFLVGLAFAGAAPHLPFPVAMIGVGAMLIVTASMLVMAPNLHRRFAARAVQAIAPAFALFGIASIGLAAALGALLTASG